MLTVSPVYFFFKRVFGSRLAHPVFSCAADHYQNLSSTWSGGPIYASQTTINLIKLKLGVRDEYLFPLPLDQTVKVHGIDVTLIDANQCVLHATADRVVRRSVRLTPADTAVRVRCSFYSRDHTRTPSRRTRRRQIASFDTCTAEVRRAVSSPTFYVSTD